MYAFGVGGTLIALTAGGKVAWERSLGEEFGLVTTHGGRRGGRRALGAAPTRSNTHGE